MFVLFKEVRARFTIEFSFNGRLGHLTNLLN